MSTSLNCACLCKQCYSDWSLSRTTKLVCDRTARRHAGAYGLAFTQPTGRITEAKPPSRIQQSSNGELEHEMPQGMYVSMRRRRDAATARLSCRHQRTLYICRRRAVIRCFIVPGYEFKGWKRETGYNELIRARMKEKFQQARDNQRATVDRWNYDFHQPHPQQSAAAAMGHHDEAREEDINDEQDARMEGNQYSRTARCLDSILTLFH
jgi:hypothetical protein